MQSLEWCATVSTILTLGPDACCLFFDGTLLSHSAKQWTTPWIGASCAWFRNQCSRKERRRIRDTKQVWNMWRQDDFKNVQTRILNSCWTWATVTRVGKKSYATVTFAGTREKCASVARTVRCHVFMFHQPRGLASRSEFFLRAAPLVACENSDDVTQHPRWVLDELVGWHFSFHCILHSLSKRKECWLCVALQRDLTISKASRRISLLSQESMVFPHLHSTQHCSWFRDVCLFTAMQVSNSFHIVWAFTTYFTFIK